MSRDEPDPVEYSLAGIRYELARIADALEKLAPKAEEPRVASDWVSEWGGQG